MFPAILLLFAWVISFLTKQLEIVTWIDHLEIQNSIDHLEIFLVHNHLEIENSYINNTNNNFL